MSLDRSKYIGGSDAAALMGSHKYKTILSVYERLQGKDQPEYSGGHIDRGNDLEPLIADWIRENQHPTLNNQEMYQKYDAGDDSGQIRLQHPGEEGLAGHPDGIANGFGPADEEVIWEIKAPTSYSVENIRKYGLPDRYKWQVHWYMMLANKVGNVKKAAICVWDCDSWNDPILFTIPFHIEKAFELEERARDLLFAVEVDRHPQVGSFSETDFETVGDQDLDRMLREYREVKSVEKDMKEERKRLKSKILTRVDGMNTVQTENNLARIQYEWGRYDATRLKVTER